MFVELLFPSKTSGRGASLTPRPILFPVASERGLWLALDALLKESERELRTYNLPPLYDAGVRYKREAPGLEEWQPPLVTYDRGWGDCEDLAAWRCAELHVTAADPLARIDLIKKGNLYHVRVMRADGTIDDPSRVLGMGGGEEDL